MPRYVATFMHYKSCYMLDVFTSIDSLEEARAHLDELVYGYVNMSLTLCHVEPADSIKFDSPTKHKLNRHHVEALSSIDRNRPVNSRTFALLARWGLVERCDGKRCLTNMGGVVLRTAQSLNECANQEFNIRSWPVLWNVNADRRHR